MLPAIGIVCAAALIIYILSRYIKSRGKIIVVYQFPGLTCEDYVDGIVILESDYMDNYIELNRKIDTVCHSGKNVYIIGSSLLIENIETKIDKIYIVTVRPPPVLGDEYIPAGIPNEHDESAVYQLHQFDNTLNINDVKELEYITRLVIQNKIKSNTTLNHEEYEYNLRYTEIPNYYNNMPNGITVYIEDGINF